MFLEACNLAGDKALNGSSSGYAIVTNLEVTGQSVTKSRVSAFDFSESHILLRKQYSLRFIFLYMPLLHQYGVVLVPGRLRNIHDLGL